MSKINTSRLGSGKLGGKIRVRFMRPWRGYPVGAVINPPGAMRQILLQAKDQLGNKVAEVVNEEELAAPVVDEFAPVFSEEPESGEPEAEAKRGRGRPRKGESK